MAGGSLAAVGCAAGLTGITSAANTGIVTDNGIDIAAKDKQILFMAIRMETPILFVIVIKMKPFPTASFLPS
jgi:F0F1-type ATP synthase membrane subunit c/vacuolar-type H+-ATPase subunit K